MSGPIPVGPGGRRGALDQLVESEGNPAPPGAEVRVIPGVDNVPLRMARWRHAGAAPRGTVLLVQGRNECIEKYYEVIGELLARGFAVAAFDLRGQGGSGRLHADPSIADVGRFEHYVEDLHRVLAALSEQGDDLGPVIALGHSTGGAVALAAAAGGAKLQRIAAVAPFLGLAAQNLFSRRVGVLLFALQAMGLGLRAVRARHAGAGHPSFEQNQVTRDRVRYERALEIITAEPALAVGPPSFHWLACVRAGIASLQRAADAGRISPPVMLFACGEDRVVSAAAVTDFARRLKAAGGDVTLVSVAGSSHELLFERDCVRNEFWRAFDAFTGPPALPS